MAREDWALWISIAALAVSALALFFSAPLQYLQRRELKEQRARRRKADVQVYHLDDGVDGRFVIENVGQGTAYDVDMEVKPQEGKSSPLIKGDYDEKLPIPTLPGGQVVELLAPLDDGTGVVFDVTWWWRDEDGETQRQSARITPRSG